MTLNRHNNQQLGKKSITIRLNLKSSWIVFHVPFRDGTTDTTRTVHFGVPTEHQKVCNTRKYLNWTARQML